MNNPASVLTVACPALPVACAVKTAAANGAKASKTVLLRGVGTGGCALRMCQKTARIVVVFKPESACFFGIRRTKKRQ